MRGTGRAGTLCMGQQGPCARRVRLHPFDRRRPVDSRGAAGADDFFRRRRRGAGARRDARLRDEGRGERRGADPRLGGSPGPRDADCGASAGLLFPAGLPRRAHVAANAVVDQNSDVWLWDLARATLMRVTSDPAVDSCFVWMPDSHHVVFNSNRAGAFNLFSQAADGTAAVKRLTETPNLRSPPPSRLTARGWRSQKPPRPPATT
jgi:hypothetical protein